MHLSMLSEDNQSVINNVCYPIELTLLALLFRPTLVKPLRDGLTITLIAFLSSLVTWLTIKGWESNGLYLQIIQNVMVIGLILLSAAVTIASGTQYVRRGLAMRRTAQYQQQKERTGDQRDHASDAQPALDRLHAVT